MPGDCVHYVVLNLLHTTIGMRNIPNGRCGFATTLYIPSVIRTISVSIDQIVLPCWLGENVTTPSPGHALKYSTSHMVLWTRTCIFPKHVSSPGHCKRLRSAPCNNSKSQVHFLKHIHRPVNFRWISVCSPQLALSTNPLRTRNHFYFQLAKKLTPGGGLAFRGFVNLMFQVPGGLAY